MNCAVKGCTHQGTEQPVLRFPRVGEIITPSVTGLLFGLVVCQEHGETPIEEIIDDAAWARITAAYEAAGIKAPARETATLSYQHLAL